MNVILGFLGLAFAFEGRSPIALPACSLIVVASAMLLVGTTGAGFAQLASAGI